VLLPFWAVKLLHYGSNLLHHSGWISCLYRHHLYGRDYYDGLRYGCADTAVLDDNHGMRVLKDLVKWFGAQLVVWVGSRRVLEA
jgi:hypothetical protein